MCVLCLSAPALLSLHREADLRDKFVRIVRFVGRYVIDIEHAAVRFIAVFLDPGGYGGDHEEKIMEPTNEMYTITARVINVQRNRCRIAMDGVECGAVLTGKLLYRAEYPVVGDYVTVEPSDGAGDARITAILPRKSCITRSDRGGHGDSFVKTMGEQVMAANVDLCFLVTSMNADYSVNRIARYASAVLHGGAKPIVVLTKADLCPDTAECLEKVRAVCGAIPVHAVRARDGCGMDALRAYLTPGTTICLFGSSGVGKSTLVNALVGQEVMRTGEIRVLDGKGRHTTTHRQLIDVDGVFLIDTPGMREFGVCDVADGIRETFAAITALAAHCRFRDCTYTSEPGCAIRQALADGALSEKQFAAYRSLQAENEWAYEKKAKKMVDIAKSRRQYKNRR